MQHQQQRQVVWTINHPQVVTQQQHKTDCFSYIVEQCQLYVEYIGHVAKKVLSKSSRRTKTEQVNIDLHSFSRVLSLSMDDKMTKFDRNKCILISQIYTQSFIDQSSQV